MNKFIKNILFFLIVFLFLNNYSSKKIENFSKKCSKENQKVYINGKTNYISCDDSISNKKIHDFKKLFYDDYHNFKWESGKTIKWDLVYDFINIPYTNERVKVYNLKKNTIHNKVIKLIEKAFKLWDNELTSINFERSKGMGNNADLTIGFHKNLPGNNKGYWNAKWGNNLIAKKATIRIEESIINTDFRESFFLTLMLHEIGNVLGLGDISPSNKFKSIQEDPFPEDFSGDKLWNFDVGMIKQLYNEK